MLINYGETAVHKFVSGQGVLLTESQQTALPVGDYTIVIRSAGGSGGSNSVTHSGGAGNKGELKVIRYSCLQRNEPMTFYIGSNGLTKANGGNGGASIAGYPAGDGGGGAEPTYISSTNGLISYALGGGGGGGAGRSAIYGGRYQQGASGGGGGGYYRFNTETLEIENVAGKDGPIGATRYGAAQTGLAGNVTDFPDLRSGGGSAGGNSGGGASGGSGSNGGNHTSSTGGPGGAGAGGDLGAGGGAGPGSATNHYTVPRDTTAENLRYGVIGNYGQGGEPGQDGSTGFILVWRQKAKIPFDIGFMDETLTEQIDCGTIGDITETLIMGVI